MKFLRLPTDEDGGIYDLPPSALAVFLWGMRYIGRKETDGYIPKPALAASRSRNLSRDRWTLVNAGLWQLKGDFIFVPSWHDYVPSKAEQDDRREALAQQKRHQRSG